MIRTIFIVPFRRPKNGFGGLPSRKKLASKFAVMFIEKKSKKVSQKQHSPKNGFGGLKSTQSKRDAGDAGDAGDATQLKFASIKAINTILSPRCLGVSGTREEASCRKKHNAFRKHL